MSCSRIALLHTVRRCGRSMRHREVTELRGLLLLLSFLRWRERVLCGFVLALAPVGGLASYFSIRAVRDVVNTLAGGTAPLPGQASNSAVLVWIIASLISGITLSAGPLLSQLLERWVAFRVQERVLQIAAHMPYEVTESAAYRDRLEQARWAVGNALGPGAEWLDTSLMIAARLAALSGAVYGLAGMAGIGLITLALAARVVSDRVIASAQASLFFSQTRSRRRRDYLHRTLISAEFQQEIRAFAAGDYHVASLRRLMDQVLREKARIRRREWLGEGLVSVVEQISLLGVALVTGTAFLRGQSTIGQLVATFYAIYEFSSITPVISQMIRNTAEWLRGLGCLASLDELARRGSVPQRNAVSFSDPPHLVVLRDVTYRYTRMARPALERVNLTIDRGRRILLVGENGAGKSTLAKLILGLLSPTEGEVHGDLSGEDQPPAVAVALQDFVRYQLTLRENVGVGYLPKAQNAAEVARALRVAGGTALLDLPRGVETVLSPELGGVGLSEGQWQHVALARAAISNAPLALFDEPTHSLDPEAEAALVKELDRVLGDRAAIIASHRLAFAEIVHEVCVMAEGRIVERGAPSELLVAGGLFARLYDSQRRWYSGERG